VHAAPGGVAAGGGHTSRPAFTRGPGEACDGEVVRFLVEGAGRGPREALTLVTVPAPVAPLPALWGEDGAPAVVWAQPGGRELAGVGEALAVTASGEQRFARVGAAAATLNACLAVRHPDAPPVAPALLGGFAFAAEGSRGAWRPFGAATFVLPRWTYERHRDGRATLTLALAPAEFPRPEALAAEARAVLDRLRRPVPAGYLGRVRVRSIPARRWRAMVEEALAAIAAGSLRKVVLARPFQVEAAATLPVTNFLWRLCAGNGGGHRFAFRLSGTTFLGSSPELLVARRGREVASEALAGSAANGEALAAFAEDPKQRAEHDIVVEAIRGELEPLCDTLAVAARPSVREYGELVHLHTPISGRLRGEVPVTELARRLHPTPAVGGTPSSAALAWIGRHEPVARGWYAGPVGVVEPSGDGAFAVALRGALVRGRRARLWAGAGIVAGSTPEGEFLETGMKARAALAVLGLGA